MLEACHFIIFTDHKPIAYASQQKRDKCSPRQFNLQSHWFHCPVHHRHIFGQNNVVADAVPRVESVTAPPSNDALASSQEGDNELQTLLASSIALRLDRQQIPGTTVSIYCDTSAEKPRPYVPSSLRLQVFQSVHNLSHRGTKATAKLVAQRFVWPGMQKVCGSLPSLQGSKVSRHTVTAVGDFTLLAARFLNIHIDLVGPLPTSAGYTYCLTAVDRLTRCQKPSPSRTSPYHPPYWPAGYPASVALKPSPPTRDVWVTTLPFPGQTVEFNFPGKLPTIPQPTDSWNASNGRWRQPSCVTQISSGQRRSPGSPQHPHIT
jgi:hypothetical protein